MIGIQNLTQAHLWACRHGDVSTLSFGRHLNCLTCTPYYINPTPSLLFPNQYVMNFELLGCSMERHEIQGMLPIISSVEQWIQIVTAIFYYFIGANFYDIKIYGQHAIHYVRPFIIGPYCM